ncbi:MAG: hypothetical protein M1368_06880 [Thaumarchaeota archaeon]|nr:hypothetical protein [Nitrososphaerota archaeon]MDG6994414.1 hypothetical protein [Nitrososphaerota archaeon]
MSEVLTVRIDKKTKDKIKKYKINVGETVRTAIQTQIQKREEMELGKSLREAGQILRKIPEDEIVKL